MLRIAQQLRGCRCGGMKYWVKSVLVDADSYLYRVCAGTVAHNSWQSN